MSALAKNQQLQAEIDARRAGALAEIALVRGEMRLLDQRLVALNELVAFCEEAERALAEGSVQAPVRKTRRNVGVRKVILDLLAEAPAHGLTTTEVAQGLARRTRQSYHPKTPGMTLTRLRRDGQVDIREGRWCLPERGAH